MRDRFEGNMESQISHLNACPSCIEENGEDIWGVDTGRGQFLCFKVICLFNPLSKEHW